MCVLPACVCAVCVQRPEEGAGAPSITMWLLGSELGSSAKAANALNH